MIEFWRSDNDLVLPINGSDIPGFVGWVSMNPFTGVGREEHDGHDFGAYLRDDGKVVVGLPDKTPVRAVAKGKVIQYLCGGMTGGQYGALLNVEHSDTGSGVFSRYVHVISKAAVNATVEPGEEIAMIGARNSAFNPLYHLHLSLTEGWNVKDRFRDPAIIDPSIVSISSPQQGWVPISNLEIGGKKTEVILANFAEIKVGSYTWTQD